MHKMLLLKRQRRAIQHCHRNMITSKDLDRAAEPEQERAQPALLAEDFDLEESEIDRRLFFEITGKQLIAGEFDDLEDTSDGDSEELIEPDPQQELNYNQVAGE